MNIDEEAGTTLRLLAVQFQHHGVCIALAADGSESPGRDEVLHYRHELGGLAIPHHFCSSVIGMQCGAPSSSKSCPTLHIVGVIRRNV